MHKSKIYISILLCFIMVFASFAGAFAETIDLYSNGNPTENTYSDGIFTAKSTGDGYLAIALYKGNELIKLSIAEDINNVSMVMNEQIGTTVKVFRMADDLTPLCVNKIPTYEAQETFRVFANEDFESSKPFFSVDGTMVSLESGSLKVSGANSRTSTVPVFESDRYLVVEADFKLPQDAALSNIDLINIYNGSPLPLISMRSGTTSGGIRTADKTVIEKNSSSLRSKFYSGVNIALVLDMQNKTYDAYVDGSEKRSGISFASIIGDKGYNFSFIFTRIENSTANASTSIYVDNIKVYSGNTIKDIGRSVKNVHRMSYSAERANLTPYVRPDAKTIAGLMDGKGHPRIMIDKAKIAEIKSSNDANIKAWRTKILSDANALLNTAVCAYKLVDVSSIQYVDTGLDYIMTLGMAYNLTGDTRYVTRAYNEITALNTKFPQWGKQKALSVGEASVMHAVCYDWMYNALSKEQKNTLITYVMQNSIYPTYNTYLANHNWDIKVDSNTWWDDANNWNAVCNGGMIVTALAFMEADMFTCATIAEAALRGLEYAMAVFAPGGAWNEGAMYWGYAMKYITAAMASLETCCGSIFGIENAEGFDKTSLFGLSMAGKTGVLNFSDSAAGNVKAPFMFYWSRIYNDKTYTAASLYSNERFGFEPNVFDLIYYDPEMNDADFPAPLAFYYSGTEMVSINSGLNDTDSLVAISGGLGTVSNHDHLDSGGVIVEMKGERLLRDIGAEHYDAVGYFADDRYNFFRARPESHNTFIINPLKTTDTDNTSPYYGQYLDATSRITAFNPTAKTATMDLSAAYGRDASSASRTISLEGSNVIINDAITLKAQSDVYWNWYFKVPASNIKISADKKSAAVTLNGKTFNISFETNSQYTLEVQEAVQYTTTEPSDGSPRHSNEEFRRLAVKLEGVSGSVNMKTIIK